MAPAIEFTSQHQDGRFACHLSWQPADPRFDPSEAFDLDEPDLVEITRSLFQVRHGEARGAHGLLGRGDSPEECIHTSVATWGRFVGCGWSGLPPSLFIVAPTEIALRSWRTGGLRVRGVEA